MTEISVEEVFEAVREVLAAPKRLAMTGRTKLGIKEEKWESARNCWRS